MPEFTAVSSWVTWSLNLSALQYSASLTSYLDVQGDIVSETALSQSAVCVGIVHANPRVVRWYVNCHLKPRATANEHFFQV